jgi:hypothetical protein
MTQEVAAVQLRGLRFLRQRLQNLSSSARAGRESRGWLMKSASKSQRSALVTPRFSPHGSWRGCALSAVAPVEVGQRCVTKLRDNEDIQ